MYEIYSDIYEYARMSNDQLLKSDVLKLGI